MRVSSLTVGMRHIATECDAAEVPADPFQRADVLDAAHLLGGAVVDLAQRIHEHSPDGGPCPMCARAKEIHVPGDAQPGKGCLFALPLAVAAAVRRVVGGRS